MYFSMFFLLHRISTKESHSKDQPDGLTKPKQSKWITFTNTFLQCLDR